MKKTLLWLLSLTWGLPMTLIGAVCALALLLTGRRPKSFHGFVVFEAGHGWGGFNAGPFIFVSERTVRATLQHEAGHGLQNVILGPLMPFVVAVPSVVRYWFRRFSFVHGAGHLLKPYDAIWFEGWATALGEKHFGEEVEA